MKAYCCVLPEEAGLYFTGKFGVYRESDGERMCVADTENFAKEICDALNQVNPR